MMKFTVARVDGAFGQHGADKLPGVVAAIVRSPARRKGHRLRARHDERPKLVETGRDAARGGVGGGRGGRRRFTLISEEMIAFDGQRPCYIFDAVRGTQSQTYEANKSEKESDFRNSHRFQRKREK